jgi:FG-GAP repeat
MLRFPNAQMAGILSVCLISGTLCAGQKIPAIPRAPAPGLGSSGGAAPVSVSPGNWSQLAKLVPPLCCTNLENAVAISGDTVVLSLLPFEKKQVAQVFVKTAEGWRSNSPVATLSGPVVQEPFPAPVAIDGETIVVAGYTASSQNPGYAFVYVKPAGGWSDMSAPTAVLTSSDHNPDFGQSVSISGNTVVIGENGYISGAPGAAYVFVKPANGWHNMTETAKLTASDGLKTDLFGWSVAVSGPTVAVGAPQFGNILNPGPGKAYVFVEPSGGWTSMTQTGELTGSDSVNNDGFGFSVSVDGNVILAGAYVHNRFLGAAYVYQKPASGWTNMTQTAELTPADTLIGEFGYAVAISGNLAVVGAPYRGLPPNTYEGGVYVFKEPAAGWQNATSSVLLIGSDAHFSDSLGFTVGVSGQTVVGDAPYRPAPGNAYVFGMPH